MTCKVELGLGETHYMSINYLTVFIEMALINNVNINNTRQGDQLFTTV